jgi:protein CpxP
MKKSIFVIMILLIGSISVMAQGGGQRRTVEERVKRVHEKIDSAFKLDAAKLTQVDSVFATYYRGTDKVREDLVAASNGERPDMQVMREKMQPLTDERDKQLKPLLGDDNFKKWKDEIEPSMRRGGGNGGGRPQN